MARYQKSGNSWYPVNHYQRKNNTTSTNISSDNTELLNRYVKVTINGVESWKPVYSYKWESSPWGSCSVSCGGGVRYRTATCKRSDNVVKEDKFCHAYFGKDTKPTTSEVCGTAPCLNTISFFVETDCGLAIRPIKVNATGSGTTPAQISDYAIKDYVWTKNTCSHCSNSYDGITVVLSEWIQQGAPAPYGFYVDFKSLCRGGNWVRVTSVSSNARIFSLTRLVNGLIPPLSDTSSWTEQFPYCWGGPSCGVIPGCKMVGGQCQGYSSRPSVQCSPSRTECSSITFAVVPR